MNISKIRVLALFGLIATIAPSSVIAQDRVLFSVPFNFTVGPKSFPSGHYQVAEISPGVIFLQSRNGDDATVALCHSGEPGKAGKPTLLFHQYGNRYFLSEVRSSERGSALSMSAGEKELIAARTEARALNVVASSGR